MGHGVLVQDNLDTQNPEYTAKEKKQSPIFALAWCKIFNIIMFLFGIKPCVNMIT